ncbi:DUF420 domain-containing protein [Chitinophaga horti]|uniref:DUF420 domain-containing protein n=1 Tax=Chitinophaga horti TaxID=2920382 RepID=A0ABY6IYT2_9BACT|nr:DUF420 domain-containing protein [Chitinophaga horti]UYQ92568.1 DUF420 domain-containing protein [Chitinophaga horti]
MQNKNLTVPIAIVSVVVPLLVAILFYMPRPNYNPGFDVRILPLFHAILNSATAVLLAASLYFVKNGQIRAHKIANLTAVALSAVFLLSYVTYHFIGPKTYYGDTNHDHVLDAAEKAATGAMRYVYYFVLLTHILLSSIIIPFVLFSLLRAFQNDVAKHRKISKITWPMWFYVAITGVVVYLMISPYY